MFTIGTRITMTRKDGTTITGTVIEVTPAGLKCRVRWDDGQTETVELSTPAGWDYL